MISETLVLILKTTSMTMILLFFSALVRTLFVPRLLMAKGIVASPEGVKAFSAQNLLETFWKSSKVAEHPYLIFYLGAITSGIFATGFFTATATHEVTPGLVLPTLFAMGGCALVLDERLRGGGDSPRVMELALRNALGAGILMMALSVTFPVGVLSDVGPARSILAGALLVLGVPAILFERGDSARPNLISDMGRIFCAHLASSLFIRALPIEPGLQWPLVLTLTCVLIFHFEVVSVLSNQARGNDFNRWVFRQLLVLVLLGTALAFGGVI